MGVVLLAGSYSPGYEELAITNCKSCAELHRLTRFEGAKSLLDCDGELDASLAVAVLSNL
jgi:hypothetical protein